MKSFLVLLWVLFFIWLGSYLKKITGKIYNKYGWTVAIIILILLEIFWFFIYFIGAWAISVYIP